VAQTVARLADSDILVINAGHLDPRPRWIRLRSQDFDRMLQRTCVASRPRSKRLGPHLTAGGRIITIGSTTRPSATAFPGERSSR